MDKSVCQDIVDREIKPMMRLLGVQAWRIHMVYEPAGEDWVASCARQLPYQSATITIDPAKHQTEAEVIDSLRHELIHVLLSPFDAYRAMAIASIERDTAIARIEDAAWELAVESTVLAVERIFDWGLKQQTETSAIQ